MLAGARAVLPAAAAPLSRLQWTATLEHRRAPAGAPLTTSVTIIAKTHAASSPRRAARAPPSTAPSGLSRRLGLDYILVVDTSSSMRGEPLARVKAIYAHMLKAGRFEDKVDRLALITFNEESTLHFGLTSDAAVWAADQERRFAEGYGTNLHKALRMALEHAKHAGDPARRLAVLVLSDGETEDAGLIKRDFAGWIQEAEAHLLYRPPVIALGFTDSHDQRLLQQLVDQSSGRYMMVTSLDTMYVALENVVSSLQRDTAVVVTRARFTLRLAHGGTIGAPILLAQNETWSSTPSDADVPAVVVVELAELAADQVYTVVIPLVLPPAAATKVGTVQGELASTRGATAMEAAEPPMVELTLERTPAAAAALVVARTPDNVSATSAEERLRLLVAAHLKAVYALVSAIRLRDAEECLRRAEPELQAALLRTRDGAVVDSDAAAVYLDLFAQGDRAVQTVRQIMETRLPGAGVALTADQSQSLTHAYTNALAILSDIWSALLRKQASVNVPQFQTKEVDTLLALASEHKLVKTTGAAVSTPTGHKRITSTVLDDELATALARYSENRPANLAAFEALIAANKAKGSPAEGAMTSELQAKLDQRRKHLEFSSETKKPGAVAAADDTAASPELRRALEKRRRLADGKDAASPSSLEASPANLEDTLDGAKVGSKRKQGNA